MRKTDEYIRKMQAKLETEFTAEAVANLFQWSPRKARRLLRRLKARGIVKVLRKDGRRKVWTFVTKEEKEEEKEKVEEEAEDIFEEIIVEEVE